jgi:ribosomal protein L37AE/L43A
MSKKTVCPVCHKKIDYSIFFLHELAHSKGRIDDTGELIDETVQLLPDLYRCPECGGYMSNRAGLYIKRRCLDCGFRY